MKATKQTVWMVVCQDLDSVPRVFATELEAYRWAFANRADAGEPRELGVTLYEHAGESVWAASDLAGDPDCPEIAVDFFSTRDGWLVASPCEPASEALQAEWYFRDLDEGRSRATRLDLEACAPQASGYAECRERPDRRDSDGVWF